MSDQITKDNANDVKAKIVVELANAPTTQEADRILFDKGIMLIPDILANAGGVVCSYFEQVQNNMNYYWSKDEVLAKLDMKMTSAYTAVSDFAKQNNVSFREAAYLISVDRVANACQSRGWI